MPIFGENLFDFRVLEFTFLKVSWETFNLKMPLK